MQIIPMGITSCLKTSLWLLSTLVTKTFDVLKTLPKDKQSGSHVAKGVDYCDKLFHFEIQFALLPPKNRYKERERLSKPLINEFFN